MSSKVLFPGEQTHVFTGLTAGATYQVKLSSESTVGGTIVEGDAATEVVTLCKLQKMFCF